jgi:hypothetical protein
MMKLYKDVRDETGLSLQQRLEGREELRLKTFLYWRQRGLEHWTDEKLSQEASRARLAEGTSSSYTPDYVPGVGSPRSLALELEQKRRQAAIPADRVHAVAETLVDEYEGGA